MTSGDLEPARGNLHVCKFLRDLMNIQICTVTLPDERVTTQGKKEGRKARTGRRERRNSKKENEGESEREGTANEREGESARLSTS